MQHRAPLGAAGRRIDVPTLGGRRHQHGARGRAGLAQRLPRATDRVRIAGGLHPEQRIGVELFVGRGVLQLHLPEINLQLFSDQHRDRRVGPLAHFDVGHGERDPIVARDADEGVRCERIGRCGITDGQWQAKAQNKASGGHRAGHEAPARQSV